MKFSRHRIKFGKFVTSPPVHASYCADCLSELEQAAAVARVSPAPALSPSPSIYKVASPSAWPMSPTEPSSPATTSGPSAIGLSMTQTTTNASSKLSAGRSRSTLVAGVVGRANVFFIAIAAAPSWN